MEKYESYVKSSGISYVACLKLVIVVYPPKQVNNVFYYFKIAKKWFAFNRVPF